MLVFVKQRIHVRGQPINPGPEPIDLDFDQYLNLRAAGCVESADERKIREDADAMKAELEAATKQQLAEQLAAVREQADADAAAAAAAADAQANAEAPAKRKRG